MNDGLHYSAKGSQLVASLVGPHIDALTSQLPLIAPLWSEVDIENPENTFK